MSIKELPLRPNRLARQEQQTTVNVQEKAFLEKAAGQKFYNLSPFTFETLLSDPKNIRENFESYLNHFSENVIDVIHRMKFQH